jgi:ABC-2 type transport system ATP-binding protein
MSDLAISCRDLRKRFENVVAVDGLDLEVRRGECFGLLGPNGAGKTTTIEILEGLTDRDSGAVEILGLDWESRGNEIRERIGISLQETLLNEKLTVAETIRLFRSFYRDSRDPETLLSDFSLDEKRDSRIGKLSGGQKQRLAVACALVGKPDILFLDEPTTGLDPQSRLQLWEAVHRFRHDGGTVLITTHYMDEAERLCDRIAVIDHGKRIALGTPSELIQSLEGSNVVEFTTEPMLDEATVQAIGGVHHARRRGEAWSVTVTSLATTVPLVIETIDRNGATLKSLSTHQATLEDVFVSMTGRALRDA